MSDVAARLAERARRYGPLSFDVVVNEALYGPEGFYERGHGAGRSRDFLTSPEVGPLFGLLLSRALDGWWTDLEEPDPFVVIEGGAGAGALAAAVLAAAPRCAGALRWIAVERSSALRALLAGRLPIEPPEQVLGPRGAGGGPAVAVMDDLPGGPFVGVVIANELLDNLAPIVVERTVDAWAEVRADAAPGEGLVEVCVPASANLARAGDRWAPGAACGSRAALHRQAARWLQRAMGTLEAGRVVCFDYGAPTTVALVERGGWLRTYADHGVGGGWLDDLGRQDVTVDVGFDQLAPGSLRGQAEWLTTLGIADLRAEAVATWDAGRAVGDLASLRARSRVHEADALCDANGLGGFLVAEWTKR